VDPSSVAEIDADQHDGPVVGIAPGSDPVDCQMTKGGVDAVFAPQPDRAVVAEQLVEIDRAPVRPSVGIPERIHEMDQRAACGCGKHHRQGVGQKPDD